MTVQLEFDQRVRISSRWALRECTVELQLDQMFRISSPLGTEIVHSWVIVRKNIQNQWPGGHWDSPQLGYSSITRSTSRTGCTERFSFRNRQIRRIVPHCPRLGGLRGVQRDPVGSFLTLSLWWADGTAEDRSITPQDSDQLGSLLAAKPTSSHSGVEELNPS